MNELRVRDPFAPEAFDDFFRGFMRPWRSELAERAPQMKVDVHEADGSYTVKAEIPGVRKEDINVAVEGSRVSITGETKSETEEKEGERVLHSERYAASYSRTFELPVEVTETGADAHFENGVLTLTLPKRAPVASKRLTIN